MWCADLWVLTKTELDNHHHYNPDTVKYVMSVGGWVCDPPAWTSCCGINNQERVMDGSVPFAFYTLLPGGWPGSI